MSENHLGIKRMEEVTWRYTPKEWKGQTGKGYWWFLMVATILSSVFFVVNLALIEFQAAHIGPWSHPVNATEGREGTASPGFYSST